MPLIEVKLYDYRVTDDVPKMIAGDDGRACARRARACATTPWVIRGPAQELGRRRQAVAGRHAAIGQALRF